MATSDFQILLVSSPQNGRYTDVETTVLESGQSIRVEPRKHVIDPQKDDELTVS